MRLGEDVFEDIAMRVEGRKVNRLEGYAIFDVQTIALSLPVHEDESVLVAQKVLARTWHEGEVGSVRGPILRRVRLNLEVVHARINAIEHSGEDTVLDQWSGTGLLCPVVVGHPLEDPRIGVVMASYF